MAKWLDVLEWNEQHLQELRFAGFSFLRQGQYDKAIAFFKTLIILDPKSAYDIQTLGALYLQTNENELALKTLDKALSLNPNHEPTKLNRMKALLGLGQKKSAFDAGRELAKSANARIKNDAEALMLAYS